MVKLNFTSLPTLMKNQKHLNAFDDEDFIVEKKLKLGKRARRTYQRLGNADDEEQERIQAIKSSDRKIQDQRYAKARANYIHLDTLHKALWILPNDIIHIIQEKAGMVAESLPLPKIVYLAKPM